MRDSQLSVKPSCIGSFGCSKVSGVESMVAYVAYPFSIAAEALFKITGAFPRFTRPPFGAFNDDVLEVARFHGQIIANWDFDSRDTGGYSALQSIEGYNSLIASRPSSILTLNHEINEGTARVLIPEIVRSLQAAGYRLVTVAECLGVEPYLFQGEPQERDDTWACTYRRRT
ncbi:chitin deacetylase [Coprinopsis cinerea AmutBmut pab1-1]|nr:chitin deacetylase [Coprinopsis cinerea AmutBmut pab1-1]